MPKKIYSILQARKDLPRRQKTDNKTRGGKCLVIAGSEGQWGAAVLCARAAARSGAGYSYLFDFKNNFPVLKFPDFLMISKASHLSKFDSIAIGPGLKDRSFIKKFLFELKKSKNGNVVLDAEALNTIADLKRNPHLPTSWILTPHEGEMARLLKVKSEVIQYDREKAALALQKKMGCIVVLKGSPTLVTNGSTVYKIKSGNSALAKAGTGDVLTGIIAGFLSQNVNPIDAACLGSFVHGLIADLWIEQGQDHLSLMASDLIEMLPTTLSRIRKK